MGTVRPREVQLSTVKVAGSVDRRRTAYILAVMLVSFVTAVVLLDVFLPMGLDSMDALVGMEGGVGALTVAGGTAHALLEPPAGGEGYAAWGISGDRNQMVDAWYESSGGRVARASIQLRNAASSHLRLEFAVEPGPEFLETVRVGFVPGEPAVWCLDSGRLSFLVYKTGELTGVTLKGGEVPRIRAVCFSPDEKRLAYVEEVDGGSVLMIGNLSGTVISDPYPVEPPGGPESVPSMDMFTWLNRDRLLLASSPAGGVPTLTSMTPGGPGDATWTDIEGPAGPVDEILSVSSAPGSTGCVVLYRTGGSTRVFVDWMRKPDAGPFELGFRDPEPPLKWSPF